MTGIRVFGFMGMGLLVALGGAGCSDDDADSVCGNELVEGTEQCDGAELGGMSCTTVPGTFTGGTLGCTNSCGFDTSQCNNDAIECGDGILNGTEECDASDLGGNACADVGNYVGGTLGCNADCSFDLSSCEADELCGNDAVDAGEDCDGADLGGADCSDAGNFNTGTLGCNNDCTFDVSACEHLCGNDSVDTGEECDGADLDGNDCTDVGNYTGGTLGCNADCTFDESSCEAAVACGNDVIDTGEDCDGTALAGNSCADVGNFNAGELTCANDCTFETAACALLTPTEQITAARGTTDGTGLALAVDNVWVTYVKPGLGDDPAGFFVQASPVGPALFVGVDAATLMPVPAVGDEVSFTVAEMDTHNGMRMAAEINGWSVVSNGNPVATLVQTIDATTDLVSALDDYESELITVDGTVVGDMGSAGPGHMQAQIDTDGITGETDLKLRMPDTLAAQLDLQPGCIFTVTQTALWRFYPQAQIYAYDASEITVHYCPTPQVVSATATGDATVLIVMSKNIEPTSVLPDGSQFSFTNGLTANAASAMGNEITVLTSTQTAAATYVVTVAASVTDLLGVGVDTMANDATFIGFGVPPVEGACDDGLDGDGDGYIDCEDAECTLDAACAWASDLYIMEVDADTPGTDTVEFIELYNASGATIDFSTSKYFVVLVNGSDDQSYDAVQLTGTLAAGDVYLLGPSSLAGVDIAFNSGVWVFGSGESDRVQNGADGVLLVRCDTCTDAATDFPNDTQVGVASTFTTGGGQTASKVDGVAYDTNDGDDAALMGLCGVTTQWNEDMNGDKDNHSLHRTSLNGWSAVASNPGSASFE